MTTPATDTCLDVVTGAFSYSGAAIARQLHAGGRTVRTLTGHPERRDPTSCIEARRLDFDSPRSLVETLEGATTLYNTYWIRFPRGERDHARAVENSRTLFEAARRAGIARIVHVSITNPSTDSPYSYFRGKADVERALAETGVPFAVVRPSVLFGHGDVLINNIAWLLRHVPVFAVGGHGEYRVRPIHVDDLAKLCVDLGRERTDTIVDAVGPDRPSFVELVETIREATASRARVVQVPGWMIHVAAACLGRVIGDVLLTPDEYRAMSDGLADTDSPSTGETSVLEWITTHGDELGRHYANELERHFR